MLVANKEKLLQVITIYMFITLSVTLLALLSLQTMKENQGNSKKQKNTNYKNITEADIITKERYTKQQENKKK